MPGYLQSTAKVPLGKEPNPKIWSCDGIGAAPDPQRDKADKKDYTYK